MKIDTIIKIPENIEISPTSLKYIYTITGPLGSSSINLKKLDKNGIACIHFDTLNKQVIIRSLHPKYNGLYKKLIENKFIGVSRGFCIYLEIIGVGYRAALLSNDLSSKSNSTSLNKPSLHDEKINENKEQNNSDTIVLKLGHSHDIHYKVPKGVRVFLQSPSEICIFGIDLNQVTQVAHSIRATRPPSVYKGKGIRLSNEKIITKAGKR